MSSDSPESNVEPAIISAPIARGTRSGAPGGDPDQDILAAVEAGDGPVAIRLCADRHGPAIGRLCMALLGSQAEADDAAQETLIAAHAGFSGFRGEGSVRAWLFGIARRRCARSLERRTPKVPSDTPSSSPPRADELIEARHRAEQARALLAKLRPTEREALLLRFVGDLSFREVGEACGIDEATARKRVSRALARLREMVKE
jgi:RNA polymerase sigma-70 factor (ECF subfamily)